jgi:hypothetical protein
MQNDVGSVSVMANADQTTEQTNEKPQVAARIEQPIYDVVDRIRIREDRNMSNMIERLLNAPTSRGGARSRAGNICRKLKLWGA